MTNTPSLYSLIQTSEKFLTPKLKWRIAVGLGKEKTEGQVQCVRYVDARVLAQFLDETFGSENWHDEYFVLKETLFCKLSITQGGITTAKCGAGEESNMSEKKGEESDAFKRACFKWGIGRFLYETDMKWVKGKKFGKTTYPIYDDGKRIYDLGKHFRQEFEEPETKKKGAGGSGGPVKVTADIEVTAQAEADALVDKIEKIGQDFPEIMENCINYAGSKGFGELSVCPKAILESFLVRLQKEKKAVPEKKEVKTEQPLRPATATKKEPLPEANF